MCLVGLSIAVYFWLRSCSFTHQELARSGHSLLFSTRWFRSTCRSYLRAFFFHRYQALFGAVGHAAGQRTGFRFVHIIFRNWLAGALRDRRFSFFIYLSDLRSLLLACLDHAIFGNFLFTIGLGQFFYHGSRT